MDPSSPSSTRQKGTEVHPENVGHPRGTLTIVVVFGLLFALGWIAMYLFRFLGRGAPHP